MTNSPVLRESVPEDQKFYLESMLFRDPNSPALRDAYFTTLLAMSRSSFGLSYASLPDCPSPLFFRCMTSDVLNLRQVFHAKEYDFQFSARPRRILDLGAYAGYSAVYLANRFPDAEIVCVEPSAANFRLLRMNTAPYEQIRSIQAAVWHRSTKLKLVDQIEGEWGAVFGERNNAEEGEVQAHTVNDILRSVAWPNADYVKCDIEGAELEIFSDPNVAAWLQNVSCLSVEAHDRFKPGCTEAIEQALPAGEYRHLKSGEFHVFTRAGMGRTPVSPTISSAEAILLVPRSLPLRRFDLVNVPPDPWGFCTVDDETFQLHPKPPGEGRSEMRFHVRLSGQQRFSAQCHLPVRSEGPVIFSIQLIHGDAAAMGEAATVLPGESLDISIAVPQLEGPCRLTLATEMSPEATTHQRLRLGAMEATSP